MQSEVLRLYFPTLETWVAQSISLPAVPPSLIACKCGTTWCIIHHLAIHPLYPNCSSPPLLPVWEIFFFFNPLVFRFPYSSIFWQFCFFVVVFKFVVLFLVVWGGKVNLLMSPSWPEVPVLILISLPWLGSQAIPLTSTFACSTCMFGWISQIFDVFKMSWSSFHDVFQVSNFHSMPGKTVMHHVTKQGARPLLWGAFLPSTSILIPYSFLIMFRIQAILLYLTISQLETDFMHHVIKKSDYYWIYANKYIAMEEIILIKSFQILEGSGREKNINASILLMKSYFTKWL